MSRNYATVMLNGAVIGSLQHHGGLIYSDIYSDVPPGHYHLTVESFGTALAQMENRTQILIWHQARKLPSWASDGEVRDLRA